MQLGFLKKEVNFSCYFRGLTQIKLIHESILSIQFKKGDIRLDITKSENLVRSFH